MKILLDSCVWGGAKATLEAAGHDVIWTGDWARDPGDAEILAFAHQTARVLITLDKDFGELVMVRGAPHAGVVRLIGFRAREQGDATVQVMASHGTELARGAMASVSPGRVRIRAANGDR